MKHVFLIGTRDEIFAHFEFIFLLLFIKFQLVQVLV